MSNEELKFSKRLDVTFFHEYKNDYLNEAIFYVTLNKIKLIRKDRCFY